MCRASSHRRGRTTWRARSRRTCVRPTSVVGRSRADRGSSVDTSGCTDPSSVAGQDPRRSGHRSPRSRALTVHAGPAPMAPARRLGRLVDYKSGDYSAGHRAFSRSSEGTAPSVHPPTQVSRGEPQIEGRRRPADPGPNKRQRAAARSRLVSQARDRRSDRHRSRTRAVHTRPSPYAPEIVTSESRGSGGSETRGTSGPRTAPTRRKGESASGWISGARPRVPNARNGTRAATN